MLNFDLTVESSAIVVVVEKLPAGMTERLLEDFESVETTSALIVKTVG